MKSTFFFELKIWWLYYFLTVRLKIFYLKVTLFKMLHVSKILIISNFLPDCLQVKTNRNFNVDGRERILKVDDLKSNVFNLMSKEFFHIL